MRRLIDEWRPPAVTLGAPASLRLREPVRGVHERRAAGADETGGGKAEEDVYGLNAAHRGYAAADDAV